jgi:hypothetical protein
MAYNWNSSFITRTSNRVNSLANNLKISINRTQTLRFRDDQRLEGSPLIFPHFLLTTSVAVTRGS